MRIGMAVVCFLLLSCSVSKRSGLTSEVFSREIVQTLRQQVLAAGEQALLQLPVTVTSSRSVRSAGGLHDFFSEGDYWWPDPVHPDSPYIQKDGLTNPANFVAHRQAMIRFSSLVGALVSAYSLTGDEKYVQHALLHCRAWFIEEATKMNPNLMYAQAIKGRFTGRGIGIIDTIHLMEVVRGLMVLQGAAAVAPADLTGIKHWFEQYTGWLTSHPYGIAEMNALNNHGTCWVMQVGVFAIFTGNKEMANFCNNRYKHTLLPNQVAADGSFPAELKRTKPYGYSLFNLDAMATICQVLSAPGDNLWTYTAPNGASMKKAIDFLYPFVENKDKWPFAKDVMYWNEWPVAHPFLVFGAQAFKKQAWLNTWKRLEHFPSNAEVIRNLPVRYPLLWLERQER